MQRAFLLQSYSLLIGVLFTLAGIGGFVGGVTTPAPVDAPALVIPANYGYLLGLFPINVIHNLFHLSIGILGLLAYRGWLAPLHFIRGFGIVLGILTLLGLLPHTHTLMGIAPIFGHDIWLHGLEAALALYLGFVYQRSSGIQQG